MNYRDEFNDVEVTNIKGVNKVEFGKVQKAEFSSQRDNKVPEGELNEKYVGKTIKKKTEINVQYTNKVQLHGSEVITSTATTTAANVATVATSVVTAASVVTVTAVAVATGISVALHDYQYKFNTFVVTSDTLTYELVITDNKNTEDEYGIEYQEYHKNNAIDGVDESQEEYPFLLRVYNDTYDYTNNAYLYYNSGTFTGLSLGQTYHITLTENRYGGETIFDEVFSTKKNALFNYFYLSGACDSQARTFDVEMDFVDEDELLSDFNITFARDGGATTIPLAKQNGTQKVSVANIDFDLSGAYGFAFTYKNREQVIEYSSGSVVFIDVNPPETKVSVFNGVIWDMKANFLTGTTSLRLDYVDDFDRFSDFKLILKAEGPSTEDIDSGSSYRPFAEEEPITEDVPSELVYPLEKTTQLQTVQLDSNPYFNLAVTYDYSFSYLNDGEEQSVWSGSVHFEDNSGAISEVYGVTWDKKANFLEKYMTITLNFQDDFLIFYNFRLTLVKDEEAAASVESYQFDLDSTAEEQIVDFSNDYPEFDFWSTYTYMFTYMEAGVEIQQVIDSGTVTFEDNSGAVSIVNGVVWDKTANFLTNKFNVQLDYQDDYGFFSNFQVHLADHVFPEEAYDTFDLDLTTEEQTVTIGEDSSIYLRREIDYTFTYEDRGITQTIETGTVLFTDNSDAKKEFHSITIDPVPDFYNNTFNVQLDYDDDYHDLTSFTLQMFTSADDVSYIYLDNTTDVQTINAKTSYYEIDILGSYQYALSYYDSWTGEEINAVTDGSITFDLSTAISEFSEFIFDEKINYDNGEFTVQLDFIDQLRIFTDFEFTLYNPDYSADPVLVSHLGHVTTAQTLVLEDPSGAYQTGDSIFDFYNDIFTYSFRYYNSQTSEWVSVITEKEFKFKNSLVSTFQGIETNYDFNYHYSSYDGGSYFIPIKFNYDDAARIYRSFNVKILRNDEEIYHLELNDNNVMHNYQYGILATNEGRADYNDVYDVITGGGELKIFVSVTELNVNQDQNGLGDVIVEDLYQEIVPAFTMSSTNELFGGYIDDTNIMAGDYNVSFMPVYTGAVSRLTGCQLVFECQSGAIYTVSFTMPENLTIVSISLMSAEEGFEEDAFWDDFDQPVKVTLVYLHYEYESTSGDSSDLGDPVLYGPDQIVLYESIQFTLSA